METTLLSTKRTKQSIDFASQKLKSGGIGIFPTDTVYGIGCDAFNINSLQNLYKVKQRSLSKPINMLVSTIDMVKTYVKEIHPIEQKLMESFWPGELTIIFDKSKNVPDLLTSGLSTVGIRMPNNQTCLEIIEKLGRPIAMSSANISSNQPDYSFSELLVDFNEKVDFILEDGELKGVPSTIVKVENNQLKILREGTISVDDIHKCLGGQITC